MASRALLAALSLAQVAFSFNCSIPPIYVDIHKRAVHDSSLFQYGLFVGLGTPSQNFSMWPSLVHNETSFASNHFCTSGSPSNCVNDTHGMFRSESSPTWRSLPQYQTSDTDNDTAVSVEYGDDTMYLFTHYFETDPATATTCHNFPASILSNSTSPDTNFFGPAGVLGLGQSSTNLDQLAANNATTSRSFGLYLGAGYDRAGGVVNGSITYGGYDSGRFISPVHNYTLASTVDSPTRSPLQVHVSQITLDFPTLGGGSINLINDTGFTADVSTSQYPLSLPHAVTQAFASALHATPANNADNSLRLPQRFSGNMTVTLSDGFQVSFPPEWVSNISNITPIAASPTGSSGTDAYTLGAAFLQYVYLAVNYDSTPPAFHLAQAVLENGYVMPRPLCPNVAPVPYQPPGLNAFTRAGLVGAAVGGVVGGSALTILVWVLVQNYLRRRQRRKRTVNFAAGAAKGVEMDDMEEVDVDMEKEFNAVGLHHIGMGKKGQNFGFRPPMTPGQPITPGQAPRQAFPFPSSLSTAQQQQTFKGPTERQPAQMTFDPPPRVAFGEEGKQQHQKQKTKKGGSKR